MISDQVARRRRAFRRAAYAWQHGKPHRAWEIVAGSGFADEWPIFQREILRHARRTFKVRLAAR